MCILCKEQGGAQTTHNSTLLDFFSYLEQKNTTSLEGVTAVLAVVSAGKDFTNVKSYQPKGIVSKIKYSKPKTSKKSQTWHIIRILLDSGSGAALFEYR